MKRHYYSPDQLATMWRDDLLRDAEYSEAQALNGPYYPEKDITADSLRAYAVECRAKAEQPIPAQFARSVVPHVE